MVFGWAVEHFEEVTRGRVSLSMHLDRRLARLQPDVFVEPVSP